MCSSSVSCAFRLKLRAAKLQLSHGFLEKTDN